MQGTVTDIMELWLLTDLLSIFILNMKKQMFGILSQGNWTKKWFACKTTHPLCNLLFTLSISMGKLKRFTFTFFSCMLFLVFIIDNP